MRWIVALTLMLVAGSATAGELGPDRAKGLVLYTVAEKATEPALVALIAADGWDVAMRRVPVDFGAERDLARALFEQSQAAARRGYRRVALIGESFGAWISLLANSSWTTPVEGARLHAVIALDASAASLGAGVGTTWREYKFINVIKTQDATRLAVLLYEGGDPDDRASRLDEVVRSLNNHVRHPVVAAEPGPAQWSEAFTARWGVCLLDLLDGEGEGKPATCP